MANRLVSFNGAAWEYDADGNVVVRRVGNEVWDLGYDAEGRLASVRRRGDKDEEARRIEEGEDRPHVRPKYKQPHNIRDDELPPDLLPGTIYTDPRTGRRYYL